MYELKFSESDDIIFTTYFTSQKNPQPNEYGEYTNVPKNDINYIFPWYMSVQFLKLNAVVIHDELSQEFIERFENSNLQFVRYQPKKYSLNDERFYALGEILKKNKNKNKTNPKKCDPDIITIGLDIISDENSNNEQDKTKLKNKIPMIEVYLQIDLIEGKIDENNMDKIKCAYDDEFLGSMFYDLINVSNKINTFPSQQVFFSAKKILEDLDNKNKITKKNGGFIKQKRTTKKSQTK